MDDARTVEIYMYKKQSRQITAFVLCSLLVAIGCQSSGQTGAVVGAGIGALAGQAIGGNTGATLIGTAVGGGIGYIIGNEKDKKKARAMTEASPSGTHSEIDPLGGTRWTVVSLEPSGKFQPAKSRVVEFDQSGRVTTTRTRENGAVDSDTENYRVVGNTLVVNKPGYIINATFAIDGSQLIIDAGEFRAVLKRL